MPLPAEVIEECPAEICAARHCLPVRPNRNSHSTIIGLSEQNFTSLINLSLLLSMSIIDISFECFADLVRRKTPVL
jgi:hypothetical protein